MPRQHVADDLVEHPPHRGLPDPQVTRARHPDHLGLGHARKPERGLVSYQSPIGKALLKRKVGDVVTLKRPAGDVEIEILRLEYGRLLDA